MLKKKINFLLKIQLKLKIKNKKMYKIVLLEDLRMLNQMIKAYII